MKTCIWCSRSANNIGFTKKAHTFPDSFGGKNLCTNVCDDCNSYFGSPKKDLPSIEVVFKEFFQITKYTLSQTPNNQNNKKRIKSQYFNFGKEKKYIKLKPTFNLKPNFHNKLVNQLKRAIYKIYLEERERVLGDSKNDKYNFIRQYARYNLGDYPIYYLKTQIPIVMHNSMDLFNPELLFNEKTKHFEKVYNVYITNIMGFNLVIPTSPLFEILYKKLLLEEHFNNQNFVEKNLYPITTITDIDWTHSILNK